MKSIAEMFDLQGHTALVTGSSRGIGRSIAQTLGKAGARVLFHGSRPSSRLEETLAESRDEHIDCMALTADLSDVSGVRQMLKDIPSDWSPDILVLNASSQEYMHIEDFDDAVFNREFTTNVQAGYILIQGLLPAMTARGWGRVISIGSVNEWKQAPRLTVYAASKCAQNAMIQSLARSHADSGVTFNNVAPGVIDTDRNAEILTKSDIVDMLMKQIPVRRIGHADDLAGAVLLLASEAGSYINGASIPVTGGMHL